MAEYVGRNFVTTLHEGNRTEAVIRDLFLRTILQQGLLCSEAKVEIF